MCTCQYLPIAPFSIEYPTIVCIHLYPWLIRQTHRCTSHNALVQADTLTQLQQANILPLQASQINQQNFQVASCQTIESLSDYRAVALHVEL